MAINIEWQALPVQNGDKDNEPQLYPRMTDAGTVDFQTLCENIAKHGSYTRGIVKGVMSDMADVVAGLLREGKIVDFEDFGAFKLAIGTDATITSQTPLHRRKIVVRGVNFQPHKTLLEAIGTPDFRSVGRSISAGITTSEQLQRILSEYFQTHESITRSQFEHLSGLKRTTAYARLKGLVDAGCLRKVGCNRDTKYEWICK